MNSLSKFLVDSILDDNPISQSDTNPTVTVLVETTERVGEFSYQPSLFRLTSWYTVL
jgi:hypothetical protein